jgi:hypothetical protein
MKHVICLLLVLLATGRVSAITWLPSNKMDPLTGQKIACLNVGSFGGYIYEYPSKYDLVFWALTDEKWICFNPKNGYGAFNGDFEEVTEEEKATLTKWLKENYKPDQAPKSHLEKLQWLEKVYGQRKMDDAFFCQFYRLMAYMHADDKEKSIEYVRKAVPILRKQLEGDLTGVERINVLYLLGEYSRRLGDGAKAKEYFAQVKIAKYKDEDGKEQTGHPYFLKLVEDREALMKEDPTKKAGAREEK